MENIPEEIGRLKAQPGKDMVIDGSTGLVGTCGTTKGGMT
jgi:hypothetical protein